MPFRSGVLAVGRLERGTVWGVKDMLGAGYILFREFAIRRAMSRCRRVFDLLEYADAVAVTDGV